MLALCSGIKPINQDSAQGHVMPSIEPRLAMSRLAVLSLQSIMSYFKPMAVFNLILHLPQIKQLC